MVIFGYKSKRVPVEELPVEKLGLENGEDLDHWLNRVEWVPQPLDKNHPLLSRMEGGVRDLGALAIGALAANSTYQMGWELPYVAGAGVLFGYLSSAFFHYFYIRPPPVPVDPMDPIYEELRLRERIQQV